MSKANESKALKAKPSFTILLKNGEIHLNRAGLDDVNRLISVTHNGNDEKQVTLLAVPGDIWRFTSHDVIDLGPGYKSALHETTQKFFYITAQRQLKTMNTKTNEEYCHASLFTRLNLNNSQYGEIYKTTIKELCLGSNLINVTMNEPFSIRDLSAEKETNFGSDTLFHHIELTFGCQAGTMCIAGSTAVTAAEASELMKEGLAPTSVIMRQCFGRSGKALLLNMHPEYREVIMTHFMSILRKKLPMSTIHIVNNRYNINVDMEKLINEASEESEVVVETASVSESAGNGKPGTEETSRHEGVESAPVQTA